MKQKELNSRLDSLLENLRKANDLQDSETIEKHIKNRVKCSK